MSRRRDNKYIYKVHFTKSFSAENEKLYSGDKINFLETFFDFGRNFLVPYFINFCYINFYRFFADF